MTWGTRGRTWVGGPPDCISLPCFSRLVCAAKHINRRAVLWRRRWYCCSYKGMSLPVPCWISTYIPSSIVVFLCNESLSFISEPYVCTCIATLCCEARRGHPPLAWSNRTWRVCSDSRRSTYGLHSLVSHCTHAYVPSTERQKTTPRISPPPRPRPP